MEHIEEQLDSLHLEDLRNGSHPSVFDENDDYDMLIVRLPVIKDVLERKSLGFIITQRESYFYNSTDNSFEAFSNRFDGPYRTIDRLLDKLLTSFNAYEDRIGDMEESLYEDSAQKSFMTHWLELKRDILRIERVMSRTSTVMKHMIDYYEAADDFPMNHYVDIHEHCERIVRSAALQLSKLDYLYSFYNTRTNEKMNRLIFFLTIISAIFLPLNLVVGFFGMNTSGLPFTEGASGTLNAVFSMGSLMAITALLVFLWRRNIEKQS
ncbi:MAG: magnesium transporter [Sulfurovum sp.]|uniref:CorA family divalent cation transporter n=1 Tax=Sulfurovum sp. TaxID=1969726 RepID=UPI0028682D8F|nr:CorA family divalent cation transporter [Sulfurovum sp.]MCO4844749.1 magnesium transporter [Sulfurovum sp.]